MDRGAVGWVQKGMEHSPSVNFTRVFPCPEVKFLLLWYGNRNAIMGIASYARMNAETALGMCARKG